MEEIKSRMHQMDAEILRLREELARSRAAAEQLQESLARADEDAYQAAMERGRADGVKAYEDKIQEIESRHGRGLEELMQLVSSAMQEERQFIQQNIADTVAVSVARIIGESRINPNYLADSICKVVEELRSRGRAEVILGEKLHSALSRSRATFERVSQLASISCKPELEPFGILVDVEDEVVDAGYESQVRKVHQLISDYLGSRNA
ncbi:MULTISPECIES: hypothetical protein [Microbulbifer]|uniref:hypothetical protein n=1 Tax=Microbulbifer TaxID=48073 RepID=UPI001E4A7D0F|nr:MULTISPECIES: hypothetical protein [Microbulbifer]UHQ56894.1 hypothetical protein LVE68_07935 [Microbulbifer sp. YPW16]